jgi:hypothetical protein
MKKLSDKNKERLRKTAEKTAAMFEPTVTLPADDSAFVKAVLDVAEERSAQKGARRGRKQKGN